LKLNDIKKIGIVGAGTMGHGIAINFLLAGYPVMLNDVSQMVLDKAIVNIKAALKLFVDEDFITKKQADVAVKLVSTTTDVDKLGAGSDFITEAIVEREADKLKLFNRLDKVCPPQTILSSNTSWLMLRDFAREVKRQDKIVITHYFAPPHIVPGVEVVKGPGTSDETWNITIDLMKSCRKVPIKVLKERPGSLLNTIQDALRHEANRMWAEGVASAEDIELGIISTFGFRSPFEGPMLHWDLGGMWKWPKDILAPMANKEADEKSGMSPADVKKIREFYASGKPWFLDPATFDQSIEERDRDFVRRLKALYWNKDKKE
jgi:3-hydroxybutyryl-CoA dehydrogenase